MKEGSCPEKVCHAPCNKGIDPKKRLTAMGLHLCFGSDKEWRLYVRAEEVRKLCLRDISTRKQCRPVKVFIGNAVNSTCSIARER